MKRLVFLLISLLYISFSYSQEDDITSIEFAGVKIGMPFNECKTILDERFNNGKKSDWDGDLIVYSNVQFANRKFHNVSFIFKNDKDSIYRLEFATFSNYYSMKNKKFVKSEELNLCKTINENWDYLGSDKDLNGFDIVIYGKSNDKIINSAIVISVMKERINKRNSVYSLDLIYGGHPIQKNENDY